MPHYKTDILRFKLFMHLHKTLGCESNPIFYNSSLHMYVIQGPPIHCPLPVMCVSCLCVMTSCYVECDNKCLIILVVGELEYHKYVYYVCLKNRSRLQCDTSGACKWECSCASCHRKLVYNWDIFTFYGIWGIVQHVRKYSKIPFAMFPFEL
jgi:hypothetical protein